MNFIRSKKIESLFISNRKSYEVPSSMSSRAPALLLSGALLLGLGLLLTKRNRNRNPPRQCPKRPSLARSKMIRLRSSDGKILEVEEPAANLSRTIKKLIQASGGNDVIRLIPLPNVTSKILSMVIEYCRMHSPTPISEFIPSDSILGRELEIWDSNFVVVDISTLLNLILAANYLNINCLLDLTCLVVAAKIEGKTPEEFRRIFKLKNDFPIEDLAMF